MLGGVMVSLPPEVYHKVSVLLKVVKRKGIFSVRRFGPGNFKHKKGPCLFVFSFGMDQFPYVLNKIVLENIGHRRPKA